MAVEPHSLTIHCLGSLKRIVYTIHNPRFYSGQSWAGGVTTMGRVYADLIRTVITAGKVLLGGSSYLSSQRPEVIMAHTQGKLVAWRSSLS